MPVSDQSNCKKGRWCHHVTGHLLQESKMESRQTPPQPSGLAPFYRERKGDGQRALGPQRRLHLRSSTSSQLIFLPAPKSLSAFAQCSILLGLSDRVGNRAPPLISPDRGLGLGGEGRGRRRSCVACDAAFCNNAFLLRFC